MLERADAIELASFNEIGSHTVTHSRLLSLDDATVTRELLLSKRTLERYLDKPVVSFAYPYGRGDKRLERLVAAAGYSLARSAVFGLPFTRISNLFNVPVTFLDTPLTSRSRVYSTLLCLSSFSRFGVRAIPDLWKRNPGDAYDSMLATIRILAQEMEEAGTEPAAKAFVVLMHARRIEKCAAYAKLEEILESLKEIAAIRPLRNILPIDGRPTDKGSSR